MAVPPPAAFCGKENIYLYSVSSLHSPRFCNKKSRVKPDCMKKKQLTTDRSCCIMPLDSMERYKRNTGHLFRPIPAI